jgi:hypothetical protein
VREREPAGKARALVILKWGENGYLLCPSPAQTNPHSLEAPFAVQEVGSLEESRIS